MKGPYQRLKYDLRRLWECPACKRRERTAGSVTFRHCSCRLKQLDGKPVVMQLVEDGVQRLVPALALQHHTPADGGETASEELPAITATTEPPDLRAGS